jgi:hypothetical protein
MHSALALVLFFTCTPADDRADLTKVDRALRSEPAYRGGARYCLLVFGPQAASRVWLVLDGENTLYVDRNANGNLTDSGERVDFDPPRHVGSRMMTLEVDAGALADLPGVPEGLRLRLLLLEGGERVSTYLGEVEQQIAGKKEILQFAASAARAPFLHFNGPLKFRISPASRLARGEPRSEFAVNLVTLGSGAGATVCQGEGAVIAGAHPLAEITFLQGAARGKALRVELDMRC